MARRLVDVLSWALIELMMPTPGVCGGSGQERPRCKMFLYVLAGTPYAHVQQYVQDGRQYPVIFAEK